METETNALFDLFVLRFPPPQPLRPEKLPEKLLQLSRGAARPAASGAPGATPWSGTCRLVARRSESREG